MRVQFSALSSVFLTVTALDVPAGRRAAQPRPARGAGHAPERGERALGSRRAGEAGKWRGCSASSTSISPGSPTCRSLARVSEWYRLRRGSRPSRRFRPRSSGTRRSPRGNAGFGVRLLAAGRASLAHVHRQPRQGAGGRHRARARPHAAAGRQARERRA